MNINNKFLFEESKKENENENTFSKGQILIISDYNLLKKSYSELRNDYLLIKKKYEYILTKKNELESELLNSQKEFKSLYKQLKYAKNIIKEKENEQNNFREIQSEKNNNIKKCKNEIDNLNSKINKLNLIFTFLFRKKAL